MYAKNNLGSLGKFHSNALMKSQSPSVFRFKPLSEIQNSIQKIKAKKKKASKSKSKSKQNTPQNDRYQMKRPVIGSTKNINCINSPHFKFNQSIIPSHSKKNNYQFSDIFNQPTILSEPILHKSPSLLSINSNKLTESNASSSINSEYQLPVMSQLSQKCVKFSDKNVEINMSRMNTKKSSDEQKSRMRTPSILKNKVSTTSVNSERSSSIKSSSKFQRTKNLIDLENLGLNKMTKSKYEALNRKYEDLNKKFGKNNQIKNYNKLQKYTDQIFPPQNTSIFSTSIHNKTQKPKGQITWKRIPELYPNIQNLIVLRQQSVKSLIKVTKTKVSLVEDYLVTSLNCIRQNKKLLQKMFQFKHLNLCGAYLIKIFQQNSWKFVIVDDLIPTFFDQIKQKYVPAFLNIQKAEGNSTQQIQIWPFLLEKAFAAYYSKYEALKYGKITDFLSELTGVSSKITKTTDIDFDNNEHLEIQNLLRQQKIILMGEKNLNFFCILPDLNLVTKKSFGYCTVLSKEKCYKPARQKLETFIKTLTNISIYDLESFPNIVQSYLCPQIKKTQGNFKSKRQLPQQNDQNEITTIRCFAITQRTKSILTIKQKDCKFYYHGKFDYKYIWIRAILLLKELNGGYRWIDGTYSNEKSISFYSNLQSGEYYLLLMPQWSSQYKYDISITLNTQNCTTFLEKKQYISSEEIFQKGCTDIAQRDGTMNQINKYICTYNYISQKVGLVIQNINNQRQSGPVTLTRSLNGLKCQVELVPVNKEFYFITNTDYSNEKGKMMKKTIEVDIEAGQNFTVVIKTMGGIDHKFFETFDFGS